MRLHGFVVAARRLELRLVTADRRLAGNCPDVVVKLEDFAAPDQEDV